MSTREVAYRIFEQLTEEESERIAAFKRLEQIRRPILNLNEKKELEEYREEKYK